MIIEQLKIENKQDKQTKLYTNVKKIEKDDVEDEDEEQQNKKECDKIIEMSKALKKKNKIGHCKNTFNN